MSGKRGGRRTTLSRNTSNLNNSIAINNSQAPPRPVFCVVCPQDKPPMTAPAINNAVFCPSCNSAVHMKCSRKIVYNNDGSFKQCCGYEFEDYDSDEIEVYPSSENDDSLMVSSLTVSDLKKLITESNKKTHGLLQQINNTVSNISKRTTANEHDIKKLKDKVNLISDSIKNVQSTPPTVDVDEIISEINDRNSRSKNIIIHNVEEQIIDPVKKDYSKANEADRITIEQVLGSCDIGIITQNIFIRRIGKFNPQKKRPILVKLNSKDDINRVFANIKKVPVPYMVTHDRTPAQIEKYKNLKAEVASKNSLNSENPMSIVYRHSVPKIVPLSSKNLKNSARTKKT